VGALENVQVSEEFAHRRVSLFSFAPASPRRVRDSPRAASQIPARPHH